jgi:hypothetical protein
MFNRTETLDFKRFIKEGDYTGNERAKVKKMIVSGVVVYFMIVPQSTLAATTVATTGAKTWDDIEKTILLVFDSGVVIALMICGGAWMFGGERGKVIERIIMALAGYLLARKASIIRDWVKLI